MSGIYEDVRLGLRALARQRGLAVAATLSLALGIGANTTIFSLLDALLLRPLPVEDPAGLVSLHTLDSRNPGVWNCSYPNYKDYRDRNQVFSSLLVSSPIAINLTGRGDPRRLIAHLVSANYFSALGVTPVLGRGFLPDEDKVPGAYPVAVIGYGLWQRVYGSDPRITYRTFELNRHTFRIVGVAPAGFAGLDSLWAADVWAPFMMYQQLYPMPGWVNQRRALPFSVVGRLKPGVTQVHAQAALDSLSQDLEREYPKDNQGRRVTLTPIAQSAMDARTRPAISRSGAVLLIVSGLVLLIACSNVANLLLVRAAGRSKEIAIRLAMGASRWRLMRQLLTESVVLALLGGSLAILLARGVAEWLWSIRPPQFQHAAFQFTLNGRVLAYDLAVSLLTGVLFGLIPAFRATRRDLSVDLKERAGQAQVRRVGPWNARSFLVVTQVAFSLVALIGAGLFVRSLTGADRVNTGFDAAHLATVSFNGGDGGYDEARGREFQRQALERAAAVPGVAGVALAKDPPLHVSSARTMTLQGEDAGRGRLVLTSTVSPGFFGATGVPILRGRDFNVFDTAATPRVAIVNDTAARHFWGDKAVGSVLRFFGEDRPIEIVGIVRTANYNQIGEAPQPMIYLSLGQYYSPVGVLYLRTESDPAVVAPAVRREMQSLDRNLVLQAESLRASIRESLWAQTISAALLGVFGGLALVLACIGIYGAIAYSVRQRAREMGIRMAVGASAAHVQRMIVSEGVRVAAVGVAAGLVISLAASRAIESMLFVVGPRDPVTFLTASAVLLAVAALACWVPARRATRIDPARALRDE